MSEFFTYSYTPSEDDETCKDRFDFEMKKEGNKLFIESVTVTGLDGCEGHPKTICTLLKGRDISELPLDELLAAECKVGASCGQQIARALRKMINERLN